MTDPHVIPSRAASSSITTEAKITQHVGPYEQVWLRSNRSLVAHALHRVFECECSHLSAADPFWLDAADSVIAAMVKGR